MYKYEVRLEINLNGSSSIVHTIIQAGSPIQARSLAESMAGPGGRIIFGPYPLQD
jgi:hypothetical protein